MPLKIRSATSDDVPVILSFIKALASFEDCPDSVKTTEEDLVRDGFGPRPKFEVLIADIGTVPVGFALFFTSYSTWEGRPGLYLEDLFVKETARKEGVGLALMRRLADIAEERGYRRLDLQVLDWNPARNFYERLGMVCNRQWLPYRANGNSLRAMTTTSTSSFPEDS